MPLIVLSELKAVLGIGDIYADAIVQDVVDAAENIILLSYLIFDDVAIKEVRIINNVARFYCYDNTFVIGQALTVSKCGAPFDGSRTVTAVGTENLVTFFEAAITNADITKRLVIPNGRALLTSQATMYDSGYPEISEACLAIACDIWITRTGTLGQQGVDFQSPAPYRLGRSMLTRVSGLLGKHLDTRGYLG
jgi:hypothetical protein